MCSEHSNTAGNDIDLNFEFETIQTRTCWSGSECRGPRLRRPGDRGVLVVGRLPLTTDQCSNNDDKTDKSRSSRSKRVCQRRVYD